MYTTCFVYCSGWV